MSANPRPTGKQVARGTGSAACKATSKAISVVKRGDSYVVGGTDAKKLVSGQARSVQGSHNKGRLSVQEVSRLVKRMKVAA